MAAQKRKTICWEKCFAFLNANQLKIQIIKVLVSLDSFRFSKLAPQ